MSMIGCFRAVSDATLDQILRAPKQIRPFLYGEAAKARTFPRLFRPDEPPPALPEDDGEQFDIEKAWHGIHFLLTGFSSGGPPPLNFIMDGGQDIGRVDVGYGPARGFYAEQVREIVEALRALPPDYFARHFDPEQMAAELIYPNVWEEEEEELDYVQHYFSELVKFLERTVEANLGMIVYVA